ncbi:unnamed protein product [Staurois parvus]|uniref:Uncharacterized protein n=1 Tax=Staurois parvus TaxID=386267 RepID=A0ABN9F7E9_9NEOB|nr:unnamed protein product [Staurois parvus]
MSCQSAPGSTYIHSYRPKKKPMHFISICTAPNRMLLQYHAIWCRQTHCVCD